MLTNCTSHAVLAVFVVDILQKDKYVELFTIQCKFFYVGRFQTFYSICRFLLISEV